ncbi:MAG: hypothetical protein RL141_834 [Candidatus Parcubacteria bacterium]|jgi:predicted PurR-regulated permease PerM
MRSSPSHHVPVDKTSMAFLLICLVGCFVLVALMVQPLINTLLLAAMFAFLFQAPYKRLRKWFRGHEGLAAGVTTVLAMAVILIPITALGVQLFQESRAVYQALAGGTRDGFMEAINTGIAQLRTVLPIPADFTVDINQSIRQGAGALAQNIGVAFSGAAQVGLGSIIFLISFFFLVKDGDRLKNYLITLSPLADRDDQLIVTRLQTAVSSVMKGNLAIALIQGTLTGTGLFLFGVPNAALWGSMAAITALIPGVGTAIVITPAVIFLFLTGHALAAFGLLLWGMIAVGLIDNLLGPTLVGSGMKLHPLVVLLAVIGGLTFFGPFGFLLGPLAVSLLLAFIELYIALKKRNGHETS